MAQVPTGGNYVVDNSTGANVRADINEIYDAILTMNSGAAEPPYRQAYTFWADTGNNLFKMRNTANDGWVELFKLDGTFTLEDGTASTPALAFRDDTNTGIFSSAPDTFNVATGGTERMELGTTTIFNEDGADVDFRIESDSNVNCFKLDAGQSGIGINQQPANGYGLDILGNSGFDDVFRITAVGTNIGARMNLTPTGSGIPRINGTANALQLQTVGNAALHIDSSQQVGIGTTNPLSLLHIVEAASNPAVKIKSGTSTNQNASLQLFNDNEGGILSLGVFGSSASTFGANEATDAFISANNDLAINSQNASGVIRFGVGSTPNEKMRIDSSGTVLIGTTGVGGGSGGIRFKNPDVGTSRFGTTITSGTKTLIQFISNNANNIVGSISVATSTTSFNTTSDYRLKENESLISDGITRLKQLKPYRFNWKSDSSTIVDGFFAHEVSSIVPESITGTKDAVAVQEDVDKGIADAIGEPIYQSIDQSKLVPLLVAAVQELIGKVEALEAA